MIEIIINHNNDTIEINNNGKEILFTFKEYERDKEKFLFELINVLGSGVSFTETKLTKIDEDTSTTIGEW